MPLSRSIGAYPAGDPLLGASPLDTRFTLAALLAGGGAGLTVRQGVFAPVPAALITGSDGWAYRCGTCHFALSRTAHDGAHIIANDGNESIPTDPAPGTPGASRIDVIWVRQPSASEHGDSSSTPVFGVAKGEPSTGEPAVPTIPAGAYELARNTITSAATSTSSAGNTITQSWRYTAVRGTPIPVRNQAERDELTDLVSPINHLEVDRLDTGQLERNTGDGWVPVVPGRLLRSASSTLGISSSAAWVTQPGHAAEFTVPGAGPRMVEMSLSALLNAGGPGMIVGARVAVDGISILATRAALTIAGSAGRFQQGVADSVELAGGVHSIAVQVSCMVGAGEATLVWSVVNVWDRGAAP